MSKYPTIQQSKQHLKFDQQLHTHTQTDLNTQRKCCVAHVTSFFFFASSKNYSAFSSVELPAKVSCHFCSCYIKLGASWPEHKKEQQKIWEECMPQHGTRGQQLKSSPSHERATQFLRRATTLRMHFAVAFILLLVCDAPIYRPAA